MPCGKSCLCCVSFFVLDCPLFSKASRFEAVHSFTVTMRFSTLFALFLSSSGIVLAQNQACSQLTGYQPALAYCQIKFPVAIPTVTKTTTTTVTPKASPTTTKSVKSATTTTQGQGNRRTRTITAVVEQTVTNCGNVAGPTCLPQLAFPIEWPDIFSGNMGSFANLSPREMEHEVQRRWGGNNQWGNGAGNSWANGGNSGWQNNFNQMMTWINILSQGPGAAQSLCSCIQPKPSTTSTVSGSPWKLVHTSNTNISNR